MAVKDAFGHLKEGVSKAWISLVRPPMGGHPPDSQENDRVLRAQSQDFTPVLEAHSWVFSCVRAVANAVSTVPLVVEKKEGKAGVYRPLNRDTWQVAALEDVNDYMSQQDLLEHTASFLALQGKDAWEIVRDGKGRMTKLFPMNPNYLLVIPGEPEEQVFIGGYIFQLPTKKAVAFSADDVLYMKFFNPKNDYDGMGPLQACREGIIGDFYAQRYNNAFFKNDATPKGILESDRSLSPRAIKRLREQWKELYQGPDQAHKIAILEEGLKYKALGITPKDMEFLKLRQFSRQETMAVFGVYPVVLGLLEGSTYANATAQRQLFYENTVILYLQKIQSQLTWLFRKELKSMDIRVLFDLGKVPALRPTIGETMAWGTGAVSVGLMTINEVRRLQNFPDVPWGDTFFGNSALVPLADLSGVIEAGVIAPSANSSASVSAAVALAKKELGARWTRELRAI